MPIIGLTGSIGSGKSTVACMLAKLGAYVIDADAISMEILTKNNKCIKKVAKIFPGAILDSGEINRKQLAEIVFKNPQNLKKLTKIIYPEALRQVRREILTHKTKNRFIVLDVPLLFEAGWDRLADTTIVVKARPEQQMARAQKRMKLTRVQFNQRLRMQIPLKEKCDRADIVIDNSGTLQQTRQFVRAIYHRLEQRKEN